MKNPKKPDSNAAMRILDESTGEVLVESPPASIDDYTPPAIHSRFARTRSKERDLFCDPNSDDGRSMAQQHFAQECDVNEIMKKSLSTGVPPGYNPLNPPTVKPQFGDFSSEASYQHAMNLVIAAQERFEMLPAKIRDRFLNDPGELLAFLDDPKNRDEAIALGLIDKPSSNSSHSGAAAAHADATPNDSLQTPKASNDKTA